MYLTQICFVMNCQRVGGEKTWLASINGKIYNFFLLHCLNISQEGEKWENKNEKSRSTSRSATKSEKNFLQPSICVIHSLTVASYEYFFYFFHAKFNEKDFLRISLQNIKMFAFLHYFSSSIIKVPSFFWLREGVWRAGK